MKKYFFMMALLVMVCGATQAQADTLARRIVLIGDAGQLTNGRHPVVDAVKKNIPLDDKTTILFLGDNLYKAGLPDELYKNYSQARAVLDSQVSIADGTPSKVYMIPGNHDWENGGRGGYSAIIRQQLYVDFLGKKNVKYYPEDGCPGPVEVQLGDDVVLILYDSQWWLHPHDKPEIESDCQCKTKEELVDQIEDIATRNSRKLILLAGHHPFKSNGPHGGYFTLKQHIFPFTDIPRIKNFYLPLPVIGSIYPIARGVFGAPQDISHPAYADMITQITAAIKRAAPNVVYVSGHDHNLQLIKEGGYNYIVSGGGCKQNRTSKNKNSPFNSTSEGFAVMNISVNRNVDVTFYMVKDSVQKSNTFPLLNYKGLPRELTDSAEKIIDDPFVRFKDTISVPVAKSLQPVSGLKKFFMGQNYRREWSEPVNMRVFNMRSENGGYEILSLGGGKQTRTLRLKNIKSNEEWVLRPLNKNPVQTIPEPYRSNMAEELVTELKSSSFPYGAMIIPRLADELNIVAAEPELLFVPDDPALGVYRPFFANTVCILEKRFATKDGSKAYSTAKMFDKILEDNDHRPMQKEVLKARLLDMLVADYDRHFDQWRWGTIDTGKGRLYYPIPRDRDQAFFFSDGQMLKFASRRALPFLRGFGNDMPKLEWLNYIARDFDRIFMTDLGKRDWEKAITDVQEKMTDDVIREAVQQLPPEIFKLNGEKIIQKLISRRNVLMQPAMKYYRFLSRTVNVVGSNQKEYFKVSSIGDKLQVRVYEKSRNSDTSFIMYSRIFDPEVTREIRLFGLHDEDVFEVEKSASSPIKIRIIGGRGIDTFDIKGKVKVLLYDFKGEGGDFYIKDSSHVKKRFSSDPPVNERTLFGFNYNTNRFPRVHVNYNSDDGLLIGAGFSRRTYGFRNLPYATDQRFSANYAPDRSALRLHYRGEFNHISRYIDLVVKGNFASPSLNNFFGWGNRTVINPDLPRRYYQTLYRYFEGEIMVRRRLYDKLQIMAGPYYYSYRAKYEKNSETVLGKSSLVGLDSANVFSKKSYAGIKMGLVLDNRNREFFPTRGIHWNNEFIATSDIGDGEGKYVAFISDMSVYASLRESAKLIAVFKFGGGRIYSKSYEYFQAMSVGAQNDLPGFRKNRYAGRSSMYGGIELRMKLFDVNSYILPGTLGLAAFANAAKVWLPEGVINPAKWHGAVGFGVYYLPFNQFAISAYAGFSEKEKMFNFSLGTKINLTY